MSAPKPTTRDTSLLVGRRYTVAWLMALVALALAIPGGKNSPGDIAAVLIILPAGVVTWNGYRHRMLTQGEAVLLGPLFWVLVDWITRTLGVILLPFERLGLIPARKPKPPAAS